MRGPKKNSKIYARLDEAEKLRWDQLCAKGGLTTSDLIRSAVMIACRDGEEIALPLLKRFAPEAAPRSRRPR